MGAIDVVISSASVADVSCGSTVEVLFRPAVETELRCGVDEAEPLILPKRLRASMGACGTLRMSVLRIEIWAISASALQLFKGYLPNLVWTSSAVHGRPKVRELRC